MSIQGQAANVREGSDSVMPPGENLQHGLAQIRFRGRKARRKKPDEWLGAFNQRVDFLSEIRGGRMVGNIREIFLDVLVNLLYHVFKQWFIEVAITHLSRKVTDGGKHPFSHGDHLVKEHAEGIPRLDGQLLNILQSPFKNSEYRRDLLLEALVRLVNPEQTFGKFRRRIQTPNVVMG